MKNLSKKLFFVLFVAASLSNVIYSQSFPIDKGSKILSGSFSFSSAGGDLYEDQEDNNNVTLTLNAAYGVFASKGLNIGGKIIFVNSSQGDDNYREIGIGPSISYFFGDEPSKLYPFIVASFIYSNENYKTKYLDYYGAESTYSNTVTGYSISLGGGLCYMVSDAVGVFSEAGYQSDNLSNGDNSASGTKIYLNVGISAFIY